MKNVYFYFNALKKELLQFIFFRLKSVFGRQFFYEIVYFYFIALKR